MQIAQLYQHTERSSGTTLLVRIIFAILIFCFDVTEAYWLASSVGTATWNILEGRRWSYYLQGPPTTRLEVSDWTYQPHIPHFHLFRHMYILD